VTTTLVLLAEYVPVTAEVASINSVLRFEYWNQISSIYAPLIDVSVCAESTSKILVAFPTAVGTKLVENAWPEATVTKLEVVAGRSTRSGCLFELDDDN
jgi:hypothetical protein